MKGLLCLLLGLGVFSASAIANYSVELPPYKGTLYISDQLLTKDDPTTFLELISDGTGFRRMFDRRVNGWRWHKAHIFIAKFKDLPSIEVQINPEFDSQKAQELALLYMSMIGQLPFCLREGVESVWIHNGDEDFGGGNNNILIHVERASSYQAQGILEEVLIHESVHTSLDHLHSANEEWKEAQKIDMKFISNYAQDNPAREDLAESFLIYFACCYRSDRVDKSLIKTARNIIPNRIAYFDSLNLQMFPVAR